MSTPSSAHPNPDSDATSHPSPDASPDSSTNASPDSSTDSMTVPEQQPRGRRGAARRRGRHAAALNTPQVDAHVDPQGDEPVAAPEPEGDVIAGDPPVPISVWHLPRPRAGAKVHTSLLRRLIANYTHPRPGQQTINLITNPRTRLTRRPPAALIITGWPQATSATTNQSSTESDGQPNLASAQQIADAGEHMSACAAGLATGGVVAVVVTSGDIPDALGLLVQAARAAGLSYLQHVVVAHQLTSHQPPHQPSPEPGTGRHRATDRTAPSNRPSPGPRPALRSLQVHTDVLVFLNPRTRR